MTACAEEDAAKKNTTVETQPAATEQVATPATEAKPEGEQAATPATEAKPEGEQAAAPAAEAKPAEGEKKAGDGEKKGGDSGESDCN
jgi:hypothetical protein